MEFEGENREIFVKNEKNKHFFHIFGYQANFGLLVVAFKKFWGLSWSVGSVQYMIKFKIYANEKNR